MRYLGYMESQKQRLIEERGQKKVNRPELETKYGFDTKFAMHMIRLGEQGIELLSTGKLSFPMKEPTRSFVKGIRTGVATLNEVLQRAGELECEVRDLLTASPLPEAPDAERVEKWMLSMYWENWKARSRSIAG